MRFTKQDAQKIGDAKSPRERLDLVKGFSDEAEDHEAAIEALPSSTERYIARNGRSLTEPITFEALVALENDGAVSLGAAASSSASSATPAKKAARRR